MRLAILGAGVIGTTIGGRMQQAGHDIVYGVRDPDSARHQEVVRQARVEVISQAVMDAEAILIAIPGGGLANLLDVHAGILDGKLILDATNNTSGGSLHQIGVFEERLPAARVYRAFNTLGWENFADPDFDGVEADLFYSGPAGDDRSKVERLIADVGLRPVWVGPGSAGADVLDGVTRLWFTLALQQGHGRHLAFRTLGLATEPKP